jgi:hypothetical protein
MVVVGRGNRRPNVLRSERWSRETLDDVGALRLPWAGSESSLLRRWDDRLWEDDIPSHRSGWSVSYSRLERLRPGTELYLGFAWHALNPGSLIIDVGGGLGGSTMALAREHPHLRFVVQDRGAVIQEGYKVHIIITSSACHGELTFFQYWSQAFPEALNDGRVKLQGASARSIPCLCSRAET